MSTGKFPHEHRYGPTMLDERRQYFSWRNNEIEVRLTKEAYWESQKSLDAEGAFLDIIEAHVKTGKIPHVRTVGSYVEFIRQERFIIRALFIKNNPTLETTMTADVAASRLMDEYIAKKLHNPHLDQAWNRLKHEIANRRAVEKGKKPPRPGVFLNESRFHSDVFVLSNTRWSESEKSTLTAICKDPSVSTWEALWEKMNELGFKRRHAGSYASRVNKIFRKAQIRDPVRRQKLLLSIEAQRYLDDLEDKKQRESKVPVTDMTVEPEPLSPLSLLSSPEVVTPEAPALPSVGKNSSLLSNDFDSMLSLYCNVRNLNFNDHRLVLIPCVGKWSAMVQNKEGQNLQGISPSIADTTEGAVLALVLQLRESLKPILDAVFRMQNHHLR